VTLGTPARFRGIFRTEADARAVYSEGAGIQRIDPLAIAVPADVDDLAALVEWARTNGASLIPRGSGSGMAGAAIGRGVIVDLSRWKHVDKTSLEENRLAVGPGVICAQADDVSRQNGLRLPIAPSSAQFCTVGGMTATNAAGAHTLAFGSMRDWVTGVECLFADGSSGWIRRGETSAAPSAAPPTVAALFDQRGSAAFIGAKHVGVRKDSSGYAAARFAESGDLVDLLVGSEGTLAFFTSIELRLTPVPGAEASVMGVFQSLGAATEAAISAREAGAVACELLDKTFLDFVAAASGKLLDAATEAILLADAEGATVAAAAAGAAAVVQAFHRAGASETRVATAPAEREALWSLRHAASPTLARLSDRLRSMQFIEDAAVPPESLGRYVGGVRAALDRHKIQGVIFGHAGDAHVHVNPLVDVSAPDWRAKVDGLLEEVTALVASLGGTLTGEHGDGRLRTPLLSRVWSAASLGAFSAVKRAFDPAGLLNPGVKTPASSATPPPAIKYDPALAPLPKRAAHALAEVERERAYASFRLDLLG
jgi:FAD/FMN-containing dehydrogenase